MSGRIFTKVPKPPSTTTSAWRPSGQVHKPSPWLRESSTPHIPQPQYTPSPYGRAAFDFTNIPIFPPNRMGMQANSRMGLDNHYFMEPVQPRSVSTETHTPQLQRRSESEDEPVRAKGQRTGELTVPTELEGQLHRTQGRGQSLSDSSRQFFEPRFGQDFSEVRIHADGEAADAAKKLQAQAFTHKKDIYFGGGEYQPETRQGRHLLAHELTHVVQQRATANTIRPQAVPAQGDGSVAPSDVSQNIDSQIETVQQAMSMLCERQPDDQSGEIVNHIRNLEIALVKLRDIQDGGSQEEREQVVTHLAPPTQEALSTGNAAPILQRKVKKVASISHDIAAEKKNHLKWFIPTLSASNGGMLQRAAVAAAAPLALAGPPGWVVLAVLAVGVAVVGGVYLATRPRTVTETEERAEPRVTPRETTRNCATVYPQAIRCSALPGSFVHTSAQAALRALKASSGISNLRLVSARTSTGGPCPGVGMHYGVKSGGTYIASISCCPCCMDTPTGPIMTTRCRII